MKVNLSRARIVTLVRWVTILSFLSAALFMVMPANWVTAAKSIKIIRDQGTAVDVWFSGGGGLFVLQAVSRRQMWLKQWDIKGGRYSDVRTLDLADLPELGPRSHSPEEPELRPVFSISRDGARVAWIANGRLCADALGQVARLRCEQSIPLSLWRDVREISYLGRSRDIVGLVYQDGRFRTFDMAQGEQNQAGSEFMGPWSLRSSGRVIVALPRPNTGSFGCLEVLNDKIYPFTPDLSPFVISSVAAIDCRRVVVGTEDGYVLPQALGKVPGPADAYGKLEGEIGALAMDADGTIFAAGGFNGIFELKANSVAQKIAGATESVSEVRLLDYAEGHLAYLSDVPALVELGSEWRPTSRSTFLINIVAIVASLLGFLYTLVVE